MWAWPCNLLWPIECAEVEGWMCIPSIGLKRPLTLLLAHLESSPVTIWTLLDPLAVAQRPLYPQLMVVLSRYVRRKSWTSQLTWHVSGPRRGHTNGSEDSGAISSAYCFSYWTLEWFVMLIIMNEFMWSPGDTAPVFTSWSANITTNAWCNSAWEIQSMKELC